MIDLSHIPESQAQTDEDLREWGRWCGSGRGRAQAHPMFRGYVPYLYPEAQGGSKPVDVLLALAVQRAFVRLPEKHRAVLSWAYCYPWINPGRVQRHLAVTRDGLGKLLFDARTMIHNTAKMRAELQTLKPSYVTRPGDKFGSITLPEGTQVYQNFTNLKSGE